MTDVMKIYYNKMADYTNKTWREVFGDLVDIWSYEKIKNGHCIGCNRQMSQEAMYPSDRLTPRAMCPACYSGWTRTITKVCPICYNSLNFWQIKAQEFHPLDVSYRICDGLCLEYFSAMSSKALGCIMYFKGERLFPGEDDFTLYTNPLKLYAQQLSQIVDQYCNTVTEDHDSQEKDLCTEDDFEIVGSPDDNNSNNSLDRMHTNYVIKSGPTSPPSKEYRNGKWVFVRVFIDSEGRLNEMISDPETNTNTIVGVDLLKERIVKYEEACLDLKKNNDDD